MVLRVASLIPTGTLMKTVLGLIVAIVIPLAVGAVSGAATAEGVSTWYPTLVKPPFNPPAWIFGPVWTVLYIMMGVAVFVVWQRGWGSDGVRAAVTAFAIQLALNALWSILFFGLRSPGLALIEIAVLWLAIAATVVLFWRVATVAGALMVPYLLWVSFATVLNASIWWLNRGSAG
jgi:tryptophan-rich sensory protein